MKQNFKKIIALKDSFNQILKIYNNFDSEIITKAINHENCFIATFLYDNLVKSIRDLRQEFPD